MSLQELLVRCCPRPAGRGRGRGLGWGWGWSCLFSSLERAVESAGSELLPIRGPSVGLSAGSRVHGKFQNWGGAAEMQCRKAGGPCDKHWATSYSKVPEGPVQMGSFH